MLDQQMYVAEKLRHFHELHWTCRPVTSAGRRAGPLLGRPRVVSFDLFAAGRQLLARLA